MFISGSVCSKGVLSVRVSLQVLWIFSKDCQRKRRKWEWSVKVYNEIFLNKISLKVLLYSDKIGPTRSVNPSFYILAPLHRTLYINSVTSGVGIPTVSRYTDYKPNQGGIWSPVQSWANSTPFICKEHCSSSKTGEVTEFLRKFLKIIKGKLSKCNFQHER